MVGKQQTALIDDLTIAMGSVKAAANALNVNVSTIWRWRHGEVLLEGAALVAVRAVLAHPGEYLTKEKTDDR